MKKYFLRFFTKTPNVVSTRQKIENGSISRWRFNFGDNEISVYDCKEGLLTDCYVYAGKLEDAETKSKMFVENILNLVDFSTSSASAPSLLISIYDASPNLSERKYKQIFYVPLLERNVVKIDQRIFEEIFSSLNKNNDERIVRAISWLRKSYLEEKFVDKFIALWTGLESINELLADFFNIPEKERKFRCPKCGKSLFPITKGVEKIFLEVKNDKDLFYEIRKIRGKILHGFRPLDDKLIRKIEGYNLILRDVLVYGIGKLLNIDESFIKSILVKKPRTYLEELRIIIKAKLLDFDPPALNRFGKQPKFDWGENKIIRREINKHGKLNLKFNTKFRANATFKDIIMEIWGKNNTTIQSIKIGEININKSK